MAENNMVNQVVGTWSSPYEGHEYRITLRADGTCEYRNTKFTFTSKGTFTRSENTIEIKEGYDKLHWRVDSVDANHLQLTFVPIYAHQREFTLRFARLIIDPTSVNVPAAGPPSVAPIQARWVDNGDSTVTDNQTKLMWQKEDDGQNRDFKEAEAYCKELTLGHHRDWRLPTFDELHSIASELRRIFANPKDNDPYWSSTLLNNPYPTTAQPYKAKVLFSDGSDTQFFLFYKCCTRAVRRG